MFIAHTWGVDGSLRDLLRRAEDEIWAYGWRDQSAASGSHRSDIAARYG